MRNSFHSDRSNREDISITLCGAAGQGIQTIEHILTRVLKLSGYNVFATKEYMSRIRGGSNSTELRVSSRRVAGYSDRIDILVPLDKQAIPHLKERITPKTAILGEKEKLKTERDIIHIPFSKIASEIGGQIYANMVSIGVIAGLFECEQKILEDYLAGYFVKKGEEVIEKNKQALKRGLEIGADLLNSGKIDIYIKKNTMVRDEILINGAEAVALGAIAGGCNFISAYPMSPSTGVLTFLSQHSRRLGIIAEQAEDEISAINMAMGAWYGGARALASTSGGGFALMEEGVSLAGMIESPVVIHIAQRPGPATGLPTRTEQGDLELAFYSGHGEFPRIIFAPGTMEDAFYLTQKAFNLAARYQIPVFVLTDQYMIDSYYNIPALETSGLMVEKHIVETYEGYKRYKITSDGISPRGVPGFGSGLVTVDSDEHDEEGHITEDLDLRVKMVEKRLKKLESLKREAIPPELFGEEDYKTLIVCWGTTYHIVKEAVETLGGEDLSILYFKQVYPVSDEALTYLNLAKKTIIIENNATSQFSRLLKVQTGIEMDHKILKYNGLPFSVEEVSERLKEIGE
ncbi:MAG: 2-oxoacid:acceptor oxidoreductase subunit alpha [bacterium]